MWKLAQPTKETIELYKEKMLPGLVKRIESSTLPLDVKNILLPANPPLATDTSIVEKLLIAHPVQSKQLNDEIMRHLGLLQVSEKQLKKKILDVFDYDRQISKNKSRSYFLTYKQGKYTCPYCNRHYTITVVRDTKNTNNYSIGKNNDDRIARPHLDHWFDKADYPLLSLNIFNLIPSCPTCNSSIKGQIKFDLSTYIHPYLIDKDEPDFIFKLVSSHKLNTGFPFVVDIDDSLSSDKEKRTIKALCLREVYAYHGMLEAKDIYDWCINNNLEYLRGLFSGAMKKYKRSPEEIYKMFFGCEYQKQKNLNRPFSKLKRDILKQFGLLDENGDFIH